MKQNVGSFDRIVRIALGVALLVVGVAGYAGFVSLAWLGIGQALAAVIVAVIGLILLVTAATRTCLIYAALGLSTADQSTEDEAMAGKPA
jgi:hypothetical protein